MLFFAEDRRAIIIERQMKRRRYDSILLMACTGLVGIRVIYGGFVQPTIMVCSSMLLIPATGSRSDLIIFFSREESPAGWHHHSLSMWIDLDNLYSAITNGNFLLGSVFMLLWASIAIAELFSFLFFWVWVCRRRKEERKEEAFLCSKAECSQQSRIMHHLLRQQKKIINYSFILLKLLHHKVRM